MSSSGRTTSVNDPESVSRELVGFEELVEWKGPVGSSRELGASVLYTTDAEDFFFPLIDEDEVSSRMAYRRPRDKYGPDRKAESPKL